MKNWKFLFFCLLIPCPTIAQEPDPNWDWITQAVWEKFKDTPHMVDNCALKIAHGVKIDRSRGWPAYCNNFEKTSVVLTRVSDLKEMIVDLKISKENLNKLSIGKIWVGAPEAYALLSWGRPTDINRTITANGKQEQWVYGGGYLYVKNGKVIAMQN
ncbi:hypothetical protein JYT79_01825 [Cardiobacterium sp. AH-315-I02]|nr:hypothetical protein [Cardiobacterium sp. AH-315-I02]